MEAFAHGAGADAVIFSKCAGEVIGVFIAYLEGDVGYPQVVVTEQIRGLEHSDPGEKFHGRKAEVILEQAAEVGNRVMNLLGQVAQAERIGIMLFNEKA